MSPKSKKRNAKAKNAQNVNNDPSPEQFHRLMEVFEKVQEHEEQHKQCVKDALEIYKQMSHNEFMDTISFGIRKWMGVDSFDNTYAQTGLRFLARLAVSNYVHDPENKIVKSITKYLLGRTSLKVVVRQFICYLIYYMVRYANILKVPIDVDAIVSYILTSCMHDGLSAVREQAASVLLLFQDRNDALNALMEHLCKDPSAKVRRSIIKSIQFNDETVPYILLRLQDTNEFIRCDLYTDLIERDVRTLTIEQRCQILYSAYNEHSVRVQAVITDDLIPNWLKRYNNCYLALLKAIKLDANDEDVQRFIRLSKYILFNLFRKFIRDGHIERLCEQLGLKADGEFINCMPFHHLSLEMLIFWWLLIQFRHECDDQTPVEHIMSDVDTFCKYIQRFLSRMKYDDSVDWTENRNKVQILIEILRELDVDEFGRKSLADFVSKTLLNETKLLNETTVSGLVKCAAKSVRNDMLGQYYTEILRGIFDRVPSIDQKIDGMINLVPNDDLKLLPLQLKTRILELKEEVCSSINENNYIKLRGVRQQIKELCMQIVDICRDFGADDSDKEIDINAYELSTDEIIKCLQIFFYGCDSIESDRAPPDMVLFYADFIYQFFDAENMDVRGWALKCGASFAMHFESALLEGIDACYKQFLLNSDPKLWSISITMICELLDKHRIEFKVPCNENDENNENFVNITDLLFDMLTKVLDEDVKNALIIGLCRLIISGIITDNEKIAYMLVEFFNPEALPSSQQILGQFLKTLADMKAQKRLISALGSAFAFISESRKKIKFKEIITFLTAITIPEPPNETSVWHNQLAIELAKLMRQGYGFQLMNVLIAQMNALKIDVNNDFKQQIRPFLAEVLAEVTGPAKQSVMLIWKKFGFKNSDRRMAQPSPSPSPTLTSTPIPTPSATTMLNSTKLTDTAQDRRATIGASASTIPTNNNRRVESSSTQNSLISTRISSVSTRISSVSTLANTIINDENASQPTKKGNQSQLADSDPTRRAFGNRANVF